MKTLFSNWSRRLLALLFPAALVASFLVPTKALAMVQISMGGGDSGGSEGDPLDTNDYGGGGGSEVHNSGYGGSPIPLVFKFDLFRVFMVPEVVGGNVIFRILVVERTDTGPVERSLEGTHAQ
jgi:hypothetical protein